MKIFSFIKALLPHMTKDQVLEDLRITAGEFDQIVAPNYRHAAEYFRVNKVKSEVNKDLSDDFYRGLGKGSFPKQASVVGEVALRMTYLQDNLAYVAAQIEAIMERDIINEGLTAKKAILVRAASQFSFISRFAADLLNYLYVYETVEYKTEDGNDMSLAPAVKKHVEKDVKIFAMLLSDYGIPNKDFVKIIESLPDVMVSSRNEAVISSAYKESDIDPFSAVYMNGFSGTPIYHIRLVFAQWEASRYKSNKEKKKMLELRLLHLRLVNEKRGDAKIAAEIDYIQSRVDSLERGLRETEQSLELS